MTEERLSRCIKFMARGVFELEKLVIETAEGHSILPNREKSSSIELQNSLYSTNDEDRVKTISKVLDKTDDEGYFEWEGEKLRVYRVILKSHTGERYPLDFKYLPRNIKGIMIEDIKRVIPIYKE